MHIHIDPLGGLAGDMFLAAALDADLLDPQELEAVLHSLGVGPVRILAKEVQRGAIMATHVHFEGWNEEEEKDHRHLSVILDMIGASDLPEPVAERAKGMFRRLGEVEAGIHGIPMEKVHFHECGALDSIFDFVSAAWVIEKTEASWSAAPVSVGEGTIQTDHGTIPLPAPASAELLEGLPVAPRAVDAELVTPTGAAILRTLKEAGRLKERPAGTIQRVGYGAGTRDFSELPNVVRFLVMDASTADEEEGMDRVSRLVCEIDDMQPELMAYVEQRLLSAGALDVVREAVSMKKGRQGTRLAVLARPKDRDALVELIFRETTTFGLRMETVRRRKLRRRITEVETPYGTVQVKIGLWKGAALKAVPEYEACAQRAEETGVPLRTVYEAAQQAASGLLIDEPHR